MSNYTIQSTALNKSRVFILQKSDLEKRLDPFYYAHEFNEYEKKLNKKPFKKFHQILKSINNGFDFRDYKESGTPYLKVANVKQGELDFTKIQYIDFNSSEISKNIQLKKGNLLLTRKGTFGNAFALDKDYDFVISSEVFYIELQENTINPKFLEIFFNSRIGQAQFDKNKIGAIMGSLSQEAIRDLKIPLPSSVIQNQIVDIYENYIVHKQKNEAEAEKLLSSIDDYLLGELGIKLPEPPENTLKNRMFVTKINALTGNRFDPFFHQAYFIDVEKAIKTSKFTTEILRNQLSFIESGSRPKGGATRDDEGILSLGGEHVNSFCEVEVRTAKYIPLEFHQSILSTETKLNDILFVKDGATTGKVGMINKSEYVSQNINEHVFLLRPIPSINAFYLVNYINSKVAQIIIKKLIAGATVTGITKDALKSLPIPIPPLDKQNEIAEHITGIRKQAQQLKDKTKELLKKASKEIEEILIG